MRDSAKFKDRRKEPRIPARFEVRFSDSLEAARAFKWFSVNISPGGLCIRAKKGYSVGDTSHLVLKIAQDEFKFDCVVTWVRNDFIGVRFLNILDDEKMRLASALKKHTETTPTTEIRSA